VAGGEGRGRVRRLDRRFPRKRKESAKPSAFSSTEGKGEASRTLREGRSLRRVSLEGEGGEP